MQIKEYPIRLWLRGPDPLSANSIAHAFDGGALQSHRTKKCGLAEHPPRAAHHGRRIIARPSLDYPTDYSGYDSCAYAGHVRSNPGFANNALLLIDPGLWNGKFQVPKSMRVAPDFRIGF